MELSGTLNHPLFQSLVLPLLLSLAGIGLLRAVAGPARAAVAVGISVLLSAVWMMGWPVRPGSVMQKLPWVFAGALLLGLALDVLVASRLLRWLFLTVAWLIASWWLGSKGAVHATVLALAGAAVIGCLLHAPENRADAATVAILASLGLAGLALSAGSLALMQLCVLLAAAVGGAGLWLWPKARIRFGAAAVAVAGLAWLALAQATLLLIPVNPQALGLLAAAFAAAPLARGWPRSRPASAPLAIALVAGAAVAGALALQSRGTGAGDAVKNGARTEDPYYENQPRK